MIEMDDAAIQQLLLQHRLQQNVAGMGGVGGGAENLGGGNGNFSVEKSSSSLSRNNSNVNINDMFGNGGGIGGTVNNSASMLSNLGSALSSASSMDLMAIMNYHAQQQQQSHRPQPNSTWPSTSTSTSTSASTTSTVTSSPSSSLLQNSTLRSLLLNQVGSSNDNGSRRVSVSSASNMNGHGNSNSISTFTNNNSSSSNLMLGDLHRESINSGLNQAWESSSNLSLSQQQSRQQRQQQQQNMIMASMMLNQERSFSNNNGLRLQQSGGTTFTNPNRNNSRNAPFDNVATSSSSSTLDPNTILSMMLNNNNNNSKANAHMNPTNSRQLPNSLSNHRLSFPSMSGGVGTAAGPYASSSLVAVSSTPVSGLMGMNSSVGQSNQPWTMSTFSAMGTLSQLGGDRTGSANTGLPNNDTNTSNIDTTDTHGNTNSSGIGFWSAASAELLGDLALGAVKEEPKKKNTKSSRKTNKDKPKRPLSAYNIFFKEERSRILDEVMAVPGADKIIGSKKKQSQTVDVKESSPSSSSSNRVVGQDMVDAMKRDRERHPSGKIDFQCLAKIIGKRWKCLDDEGLSRYKSIADSDMKRYRSEMEEWNAKDEKNSSSNDVDTLTTVEQTNN